jgi:hypothetical protein
MSLLKSAGIPAFCAAGASSLKIVPTAWPVDKNETPLSDDGIDRTH